MTTYSHHVNSDPCDINQLVERWNNWARIALCADYENYLNGNRKFLFEWHASGNAGIDTPNDIPIVLAESHSAHEAGREVGDLSLKRFGGNPCVVARWNEQSMLVNGVHGIDQTEKFVSSKITIGLQVHHRLEESGGHPIGESVLYGFVKPCLGFAEGELHSSFLLRGLGKRRNDLPVRMIERGLKVVDGISGNQSRLVYDGFVLFGVGGALTGLVICCDDVDEGSFIAEEFVQLKDVFRGPIDLE